MALQRPIRCRLKPCFVPATLLCVALCPGAVWARINLPQTDARVQLNDATAETARDFFQSAGGTEALPAPLQQLLIESLPPVLAPACRELTQHWGTEALGTDFWTVRSLHRGAGKAWLAFRCGSHLPVYAKSYDERLALLDWSTGSLAFVPLGPDAENDSGLYHLEFARALPVPNGNASAFRVTIDNDNPCCDGGERVHEERFVALVFSPGGACQVLSVVTAEDTYVHDDEVGDSEIHYKVELEFGTDSEGRAVSVTARYRQETRDYNLEGHLRQQQPAPRTGKEVFRWDAASGGFAKVSGREKAP